MAKARKSLARDENYESDLSLLEKILKDNMEDIQIEFQRWKA